ncbi:MAG TPA: DinB family protein [Blastocatellia bacterium]
MEAIAVEKPARDEYAPRAAPYVNLVEGPPLAALTRQIEESLATLRSVSDQGSLYRYEPGKWSLREVVGHIIDSERVFAYRAMRFARADQTELAGFEQDDYVAAANFDSRPWPELLSEFEIVRRSSVLLFGGFDREAWLRRGAANNNPMSVRAGAYLIAGHELHHMRIIRERYLAR